MDVLPNHRSALLILHYQPDVFDLVFAPLPDGAARRAGLIARCNAEIGRWRDAGGQVIFANFVLPYGTPDLDGRNKLLAALAETGRFTGGECLPEIDRRPDDRLYLCPRVNIFARTTLHDDLKAIGIDHLRIAGVTSSGVLLSSIAWASDADYAIELLRACCFDPDTAADEALFRTGFATRTTIVG